MPDDNRYRTITRIIEMHGPPDWLEQTLANSRIPIQGVKQFQNGSYIKSGIILWQGDGVTEAQVDEQPSQLSTEMRRAIEEVKTVPFKKPGE